MFPIYNFRPHRLLSPADYLQFIASADNRQAIKKVRIIPPKLGSPGWGKIYVELKYEPKRFPFRSQL